MMATTTIEGEEEGVDQVRSSMVHAAVSSSQIGQRPSQHSSSYLPNTYLPTISQQIQSYASDSYYRYYHEYSYPSHQSPPPYLAYPSYPSLDSFSPVTASHHAAAAAANYPHHYLSKETPNDPYPPRPNLGTALERVVVSQESPTRNTRWEEGAPDGYTLLETTPQISSSSSHNTTPSVGVSTSMPSLVMNGLAESVNLVHPSPVGETAGHRPTLVDANEIMQKIDLYCSVSSVSSALSSERGLSASSSSLYPPPPPPMSSLATLGGHHPTYSSAPPPLHSQVAFASESGVNGIGHSYLQHHYPPPPHHPSLSYQNYSPSTSPWPHSDPSISLSNTQPSPHHHQENAHTHHSSQPSPPPLDLEERARAPNQYPPSAIYQPQLSTVSHVMRKAGMVSCSVDRINPGTGESTAASIPRDDHRHQPKTAAQRHVAPKTKASSGSSSSSYKSHYACTYPDCDKSFSRESNLRAHMCGHTGERPYACSICDTTFAREHDLRRHVTLHSGVKNYVCPLCDHKFARKDALRRHLASRFVKISDSASSNVGEDSGKKLVFRETKCATEWRLRREQMTDQSPALEEFS